MAPSLIITIIVAYFLVLILVSWITNLNSDKQSFYLGNKKSPWYLVSFGMIGATLSGVTFISIPGTIGNLDHVNGQFSYLQVVLGYSIGYFLIAYVLLPIYYRLNLTSIYGYLENRFGWVSRKTGAFFFLFSRVIGASFRLYLVAIVLDKFIFAHWGVPFWATVAITILFIWVYTFKGGIKTIIYTDTLQTAFMLLAVILTIVYIVRTLDIGGYSDLMASFDHVGIKKGLFWDWGPRNFFKQVLSGIFLALVMTGLDQDMMQKNLSCRNLGEAKKNMLTLGGTMVIVNTLFVVFGALLYVYADKFGVSIPAKRDYLYPMLALEHFSPMIGVFFILGLIAAAYSSADSALTALTTSFVVDFLEFEKKGSNIRLRTLVHVGFSVLILLVIILFKYSIQDSVITELFRIAGLTYGPLLGMFAFGILTKMKVKDRWVWFVCFVSVLLSFGLMRYSESLFGFKVGFELLIYNGLFTFIGLAIISFYRKNNRETLDEEFVSTN
jgi:Na+/proline symporter